tara:strand:- start:4201 stop:4821 length:621 start_codon:yes stop_codon:yes gene_type:complete
MLRVINLEIVIFANSYKDGGRCIAGKTVNEKKWVRPVSNENGGELSQEQIKYKNKYGVYSVKTLQKIKLKLLDRAPLPNQPENYLISNELWTQNYAIQEKEIYDYLDHPDSLWGNGDRVSIEMINKKLNIKQSLYLVKVEKLKLFFTEENKRRAEFCFNGINYNFAVTDPKFDHLINEPKKINDILCISLGSNYEGNCYKLVAGIF